VVPPAPIDAPRLAAAQRQLAQVDAQTQLESYVASLRQRSKVKIYDTSSQQQAGAQ
jgi:peptidyl-prolyl cis-trans isomerase D